MNVRVALRSQPEPLTLKTLSAQQPAQATSQVALYGIDGDAPVYARNEFAAQQVIQGPALITETVSTTWLAPGWKATVDEIGNLVLDNINDC